MSENKRNTQNSPKKKRVNPERHYINSKRLNNQGDFKIRSIKQLTSRGLDENISESLFVSALYAADNFLKNKAKPPPYQMYDDLKKITKKIDNANKELKTLLERESHLFYMLGHGYPADIKGDDYIKARGKIILNDIENHRVEAGEVYLIETINRLEDIKTVLARVKPAPISHDEMFIERLRQGYYQSTNKKPTITSENTFVLFVTIARSIAEKRIVTEESSKQYLLRYNNRSHKAGAFTLPLLELRYNPDL